MRSAAANHSFHAPRQFHFLSWDKIEIFIMITNKPEKFHPVFTRHVCIVNVSAIKEAMEEGTVIQPKLYLLINLIKKLKQLNHR